ncbi:MAG: aminotransferase class III-fold pyridoxal phosphate-dependent enzyme [Bacteroidales bacterium]|nr:aminotransferase class III-fold pyridoxal phosphate-dependent enzyme [Bacteroidales bacterium]
MKNISRSSMFGIKIDFEKSKGSILYDKVTKREFIDFFGMYSTVALGYNHPIYSSDEFQKKIVNVAKCKITNCEILSEEAEDFNKHFTDYVSLGGKYTHFHYSCTGALAIEAAVKTAIDYKGYSNPMIISFNESFHGINGYGGFLTTRLGPVGSRLNGFPGPFWPQLENPVITYKNGITEYNIDRVESTLTEIERIIKLDNSQVAGILVEPIQCTFGDKYFAAEFFQGLRKLADTYDIPLIFDEIQIGFGGTGKIWYFEHLDIEPDILVFGKKVQLAGIMVKEKFSKIFKNPIRLEVTWDADIVDMVRSDFVIKAYQDYNILDNVNKMSSILVNELKTTTNLQNIRSSGLIIAFDFETEKMRNSFDKKLYKKGLICNKSMDKTIRFRPNLYINSDDINRALGIVYEVDKML